jgi:Amt family ammonium transporter
MSCKTAVSWLLSVLTLICIPALAHAQEAATAINAADTVWVLVSAALVMLMVPGLAFFYSGMVHSNNVVATIMHSYMKLCTITLVWVLWGYSLAFGQSHGGLIGGFDFLGFVGVGQEALSEDVQVPHYIFAMFQGMFAIVTAAIITGAFAERVRLGPILIFSTLWITVVYAPVAHWVWGGGWIATQLEALDFAGGAVVHINSGVAGLIAALILGRRIRLKASDEETRPHNLPLVVLGASLLWFGWFGFNAGSALGANGLAALAFANTAIAGAAGGFGWFAVELFHKQRSTAIGIISGSVAGLVSITPAAGFVTPLASIAIGLIGSVICYWAVMMIKPRFGYDDSLDAFGIHGVGGLWGALATGIFATTAVNEGGANGLLYGGSDLFVAEVLASLAVIAYSAVATYAVLQVLRLFVKVRVSEEEEAKGLDATQHGEVGYVLS